MALEQRIDYIAGSTKPDLRAVLGTDGKIQLSTGAQPTATSPTDITGYGVLLRIRKPDDTVLEKTATITDATNGQFKFTWSAADLAAGQQEAQLVVTDAGGGITKASGFYMHVVEAV